MTRPWPTDPMTLLSLVSLEMACLMVAGGCRNPGALLSDAPVSPPRDQEIRSVDRADQLIWSDIRGYAEDSEVPPDLRRRAQGAVAGSENGTLDPEPILVQAALAQAARTSLVLYMVDEDEDILGVRIKEEHVGPDRAAEVVEETYPVYVSFFSPAKGRPYWIPVKIRDQGQRKDTQAWEAYLTETIDWLIRKYIQREEGLRLRFMPTVWISAPSPGETRVYVSVYDRRGHESEYVEVE